MRLFDARVGEPVQISRRPVPFSFFPTYKRRRDGVSSTLFVTNPWNIIRSSIENISNSSAQEQSIVFFDQAHDFFIAAKNADVSAAKPLLLYYSFLNLAKCFIVQKRGHAFRDKSKHGIGEGLDVEENKLIGRVYIQSHKASNVFSNFAKELKVELQIPGEGLSIPPKDLLSQILVGHRILFQDERPKERFINLDKIDYMYNTDTKETWLRARAYRDDFTRLGYSLTSLSERLSSDEMKWRNVNCSEEKEGRLMLEAETVNTFKYRQTPSRELKKMTQNVRPKLWRTVTAYRPYREYYIYQSPKKQILLDQIVNIYLTTFSFSSITRYKPEQFETILKGPNGPFVLEFFANQPSQFLYLMASEFMEQEVTNAAVI